LQAVRNENTFTGSASQLGYTGTATGHLDMGDLVIEVSALSNGTNKLPAGKAQLHRP
jgi:hypothetical protein